jgi:RNA polymerase sigma-70 factor (ECF subfamily)
MRRFSLGEEASFVELVQRHQQSVVSYLARLLGNASRAEELGQEVFVRVFRHRASYNDQAQFTTWCYTIATNLARDEIRARRRRPASAGPESLDGIPGRDEAPSASLERRELRGRVRTALADMQPQFREVLTLRDLEGCSYEEIAEALQMELGTVKSRINRARSAFKAAFMALGGMKEEGV